MHGLRSAEVLALNPDDVLLSEGQLRVRGKGSKLRFLPLAPETTQLIDHYLRLERPDPCSAALFVVLKGPARGTRMTPAGLRSLFRYHRQTTGIQLANPHRFRHTFASDMVRAGISLPALMQLMGHADIQTTLHYVQVSPQDVYLQYARAAAHCASILSRGSRREALAPPSAPASAGAGLRACRRVPLHRAQSFQHTSTTTQRCVTSSSIWQPSILKLLGLEQLRRDPHVLGWMASLRAQIPPLATATCIARLIALRAIFSELAWTSKLA